MRIAVRAVAVIFVVVSLIMLSAPVSASLIGDAGLAYNDGATTWAGSTSFDDGGGLTGYVEWVVYGPGDFPTTDYSGYTPTAGEFVYAYQIFQTGTHGVSSLDVNITLGNPKNNIGSFFGGTVSGNAPTSTTLGLKVADWDFNPAIPVGYPSMGLSFSSPNEPVDLFGSVVNGGDGTWVVPLPSPSSSPISPTVPEPSTLMIWLFGVGLLTWTRRRYA